MNINEYGKIYIEHQNSGNWLNKPCTLFWTKRSELQNKMQQKIDKEIITKDNNLDNPAN